MKLTKADREMFVDAVMEDVPSIDYDRQFGEGVRIHHNEHISASFPACIIQGRCTIERAITRLDTDTQIDV